VSVSVTKPLSRKQLRVVELVAQGRMNKEIAAELGTGMGGVISHLKEIQSKAGPGEIRDGCARSFAIWCWRYLQGVRA